ncbi:glycosyltransferase [Kutzneria sp. NPDC051319]|uniref:glycosyltransferase n=1 Tax=Kutzneria sp. NPDC051319 TaxID=3155047 RepID=UPI00343DEF49
MAGRVVYAALETQFPLGGIRVLSQQVELLRAAGVEAFRWTPTPGFRYKWFDDTVPTLSGMNLELGEDDLLVVPEVAVVPDRDPARGAHSVIYSQGHYITFLGTADLDPYPGWAARPALWTVSQAGAHMLRRALPGYEPHLVPPVIDTDRFRPADKVRRVAWMSRRRPMESTLLRRLLRSDPRSAGVELHDINGVSHEEVARVLSETSVFIALSTPEGEGFGLPTAEALAAGCLVTGYTGGGGAELYASPAAWPVPELATDELADKALELLDHPDKDEFRRVGRQWIQQRYNAETATDALLEGIRLARAQPGRAATAVHPTQWTDEIVKHFRRPEPATTG